MEQEIKGLTSEEVARLTEEGKANVLPNSSSQSVGSIFFNNVFTYFNFIFFGLAFLVIMVGAYRNLTFMVAVILNMIIGIIQQLRAKTVLDKLALLDVTKYTAIRDGAEQTTDMEKLVLGDYIKLTAGQQIPADSVVVDGKVSVNESLLTGEADEIEKENGAELMSGSVVMSGECIAKIEKVGIDSYAASLTAKAKEVKQKKSEMIKDIELIVLIAGIAIIPVGLLMIFSSVFINGESLHDGVVSMVGAVVGMIPEGLYLLLTIALTMSAARLAVKKVLLHDMKSIETLAAVDVLCVDKTGTITNESMSVTDIYSPKQGEGSKFDTPNQADGSKLDASKNLLAKYIYTIPDSNITMNALREHISEESAGGKLNASDVMAFSSKTKYSEIVTDESCLRFGAPEFLLTQDQQEENRELIEAHTGKGERVLAFVSAPLDDRENFKPLLFVSMANEIRETAPETFKYFAEQGVKIKVISGDNPMTVSRVAMAANIEDADCYVDASTLTTEEDYLEAVKKYTVFGRVKPEQKKELIEAIKKNGQKVAMTGDGVNDILAMKEADCSIAMGSGSDAARQAAQVVLMDSDFSRMMNIVSEGRRIVNNMTRSGILFLYKNIFSFVLAVFTIIFSLHFPLKPTQISLISMFNIGLPGFLLAMENNTKRQRGRLLYRTMIGAFPTALYSFVAVFSLVMMADFLDLSNDELGVAGTFILSGIGFVLLWKNLKPLNRYRIFVFSLCVVGMIVTILTFWNIFILATVTFRGGMIGVGYTIVCSGAWWLIQQFIGRKEEAVRSQME